LLTVGLLHATRHSIKNIQLIRSLLKTFGKLWSTEGLTVAITAIFVWSTAFRRAFKNQNEMPA